MAPTALIIDDNSVVRHFLRLKLVQRGWNVVEAKDSYEGLLTLREVGPELVTLDLIMPIDHGIDAMQLAQMIHEEDPKITILIVSSFAVNEDLQGFCQKKRIELFEKTSVDNPNFDKLFERVDRLFSELGLSARRQINKSGN
jgi:CheY-like chemotaxis protein